MFTFPTTRPDGSPVDLWRIQQEVLQVAEALLGARNRSKQICQPVFDGKGPYLVNTPNRDGAFAALSMGAAGYWPTTVYELAHETVHLLDPVEGATTWLEEGVAVAFAVHVAATYTSQGQTPSPGSPYAEALDLVHQFADPCFPAARHIRSNIGPLSSVSEGVLAAAFPQVSGVVLSRLANRWTPRW